MVKFNIMCKTTWTELDRKKEQGFAVFLVKVTDFYFFFLLLFSNSEMFTIRSSVLDLKVIFNCVHLQYPFISYVSDADLSDILKSFHELLSWNSIDVQEKTVTVIGVFSRSNYGRKLCCDAQLISLVLNLLKQNCGKENRKNIQILIESCRSLANLCFENSKYGLRG